MKNKKPTKGILVDIGILLVCLLVVSTCLASGVFAKFITSVTGAKDNGRIAGMNVDVTSADDLAALEIKPGAWTKTFTLNVTSASEVAVRYTVELRFDGEIVPGLTAKLGPNADSMTEGVIVPAENKIVWKDLGTIAAGGPSVPLILEFSFDSIVGAAVTEVDYDFAAVVTFTQID